MVVSADSSYRQHELLTLYEIARASVTFAINIRSWKTIQAMHNKIVANNFVRADRIEWDRKNISLHITYHIHVSTCWLCTISVSAFEPKEGLFLIVEKVLCRYLFDNWCREELWHQDQQDRSQTTFPPASLYVLLSTYLRPNVDDVTKHRIAQYLFLDRGSTAATPTTATSCSTWWLYCPLTRAVRASSKWRRPLFTLTLSICSEGLFKCNISSRVIKPNMTSPNQKFKLIQHSSMVAIVFHQVPN